MTTALMDEASRRKAAATLVMVSLPEGLMGPTATHTPLPQAIVQITQPLARGCLTEVAPLVACASAPHTATVVASRSSPLCLTRVGARLASLEEPEYLTLTSGATFSLSGSSPSSQGSRTWRPATPPHLAPHRHNHLAPHRHTWRHTVATDPTTWRHTYINTCCYTWPPKATHT